MAPSTTEPTATRPLVAPKSIAAYADIINEERHSRRRYLLGYVTL